MYSTLSTDGWSRSDFDIRKEELEVGDSSELVEQREGEEVPGCVVGGGDVVGDKVIGSLLVIEQNTALGGFAAHLIN